MIDPKTKPQAIEAEQALLGVVMYDPDALEQVNWLGEEHFGEPTHAAAWGAIMQTSREGGRPDAITVHERIQANTAYLELGGMQYLADLVDKAPSTKRAGQYAALVANASRLRGVLDISEGLREGAAPGADAHALLVEASHAIDELIQEAAPPAANLIDARTSAEARLDQMDKEAEEGRVRGLMTGLRCVDRRLGGLKPGNLIIIGGRPSMGKTALARNIALGCARRNPHIDVIFHSLEMEREEMDDRTLSQMSYENKQGVQYRNMGGGLTLIERATLRDALKRLPGNLLIDDTVNVSADLVRRRAMAHKRKRPVGLIVIDYLQIMKKPAAMGRNETTVIGEITADLKRLARQVGCAIILLSQIGRGVEGRDDKRPQISDLKDSGSIEQDADAILLPYRPIYYLERNEPKEPKKVLAWELEMANIHRLMEVYAGKVRQGPVGMDRQDYFAEYDLIRDQIDGGLVR